MRHVVSLTKESTLILYSFSTFTLFFSELHKCGLGKYGFEPLRLGFVSVHGSSGCATEHNSPVTLHYFVGRGVHSMYVCARCGRTTVHSIAAASVPAEVIKRPRVDVVGKCLVSITYMW